MQLPPARNNPSAGTLLFLSQFAAETFFMLDVLQLDWLWVLCCDFYCSFHCCPLHVVQWRIFTRLLQLQQRTENQHLIKTGRLKEKKCDFRGWQEEDKGKTVDPRA